jgi:predicted membrane metal-binding protein
MLRSTKAKVVWVVLGGFPLLVVGLTGSLPWALTAWFIWAVLGMYLSDEYAEWKD